MSNIGDELTENEMQSFKRYIERIHNTQNDNENYDSMD